MASRATLNISLPPELHRFVNDKVKSGRYTSASEVVREGLRLLEQEDQQRKAALEAARRKIAVGLDQLDRGEGIDGEAAFTELEQRSQSRRRAKSK